MRLRSHNEFGKGWTSRYRAWKLLYSKEFLCKKEAKDDESWLKSGSGWEFIRKQIKK